MIMDCMAKDSTENIEATLLNTVDAQLPTATVSFLLERHAIGNLKVSEIPPVSLVLDVIHSMKSRAQVKQNQFSPINQFIVQMSFCDL